MIEKILEIVIVYSLVIWLGGTLHLAISVVPTIAKKVNDHILKSSLIGGIMSSYNRVSWAALLSLLVGVLLITLLRASSGITPLIIITAALVSLLTILDFLHSFIYGPRAVRDNSQSARRMAMRIARVETLLAIPLPILIFLALA